MLSDRNGSYRSYPLVTGAVLCGVVLAGPAETTDLATLIDQYVWSTGEVDAARRLQQILSHEELRDADDRAFQRLAAVLAQPRPMYPVPGPDDTREIGGGRVERVVFEMPDGREMSAVLRLPPNYTSAQRWPLIIAMHGGPLRAPREAIGSAFRMLDIWREPAAQAGWIIAAPAMTHVIAHGRRTPDRLPYEILRLDQFDAALTALMRRYAIDSARIITTGVSLGANFSTAYAAARPGRFLASVPVSTEGESREALLRNLRHTPTYVLQGEHDTSIRNIQGARAMAKILGVLGFDIRYREMQGRRHESFHQFYPEVLEWVARRARVRYPQVIERVPHSGIVSLARRVHWIETDTQQAVVSAALMADNLIDIRSRWTRTLKVYLNDEMVSLDQAVRVRVNGVDVGEFKVERSLRVALEEARRTKDTDRFFTGLLQIRVPTSAASIEAGIQFSESMRPTHPQGTLSFWESYATRSLEERFPTLGLRGSLTALPKSVSPGPEQRALEIESTDPGGPFSSIGILPGDRLIEIGGEPFFAGKGLNSHYQRLLRELDSIPRSYVVQLSQDGALHTLKVHLALGDYQR